jgi:penicillin-binding protein 1A
VTDDDDWILPPSKSIDSALAPEAEPEPQPSFGRTPNHEKPPKAAKAPKGPRPPKPPKPPKSPRPYRRGVIDWGDPRLWGSALAVVAVVVVGAGVWATLTVRQFLAGIPEIPPVSAMMVVNQAPGMTFEDRTGRVLATRGPKHGFPVTLPELPAYVPQAFLAAEDRRFYHHGPVDLRGMARAAFVNWRAHHTVQGGSTLTQQLAKTLFLTPNQTLKRKLQEAVIADRMEKAMSKDQVLEVYLNRIFFGDNAYGIDAASETYFGEPARQLTVSEAALLASLPKAPTRLALTNDMDRAVARSRLVLHNMREEGWITDDQEQTALANPPRLAPEAPGEGDFGYVLDMASAEAVKIAGGQAPDLVVRLSIDPAMQTAGQAIVRQTIAAEGKAAGVKQGALVLIAPDGGIRAMVGGINHRLSAFNRATQAQRQPGSSFKPFVYAAALEQGVKPTDTRVDGPVRFGLWSPTNYEPGYRGTVTVAEALAHSINTVAARLADEVGSPKLGEIAHRFGLKSIPDDPNLSVALGTYEVNLLELTSGYQVFQQGGQRIQPYLIEQIATTRGDMLYSHVASAGMPVYDVAHDGDMVRMMEGVITHGTATRAGFGRPAAGKTGTTQNWRDAWFVGFTPDWVCGVWIGNDDNTPMNKITGGNIPAQIWRQMMITAHQNMPVRDFAWMLPPAAPDPADVADSGAPAADIAAATAMDSKAAFYDSLTSDFDDAARNQGHAATDQATPPRDDPDPHDGGPIARPAPEPER